MTDQPGNASQSEGDQNTIDADLGNYDESGHPVAAPSADHGSTTDVDQSGQAKGAREAIDDDLDVV